MHGGVQISMGYKKAIMDMINRLDVNHKVGRVQANIMSFENVFDEEMIKTMNQRYKNIQDICIFDSSDSIDSNLYDEWLAMVEQKPLL